MVGKNYNCNTNIPKFNNINNFMLKMLIFSNYNNENRTDVWPLPNYPMVQ